MQEKHSSQEEILQNAFDRIYQEGLQVWLASHTIENLEELLKIFESHIGEKLQESINIHTLQGVSPKERLFEIILVRFEYMAPYKKGLQAIVDQGWKYPKVILGISCLEQQVAQEILKLANISTEGPIGYAKEKGVLGVYLLTFYKWLGDKTESLEVTMAFLDQALTWCDGQMERYM